MTPPVPSAEAPEEIRCAYRVVLGDDHRAAAVEDDAETSSDCRPGFRDLGRAALRDLAWPDRAPGEAFAFVARWPALPTRIHQTTGPGLPVSAKRGAVICELAVSVGTDGVPTAATPTDPAACAGRYARLAARTVLDWRWEPWAEPTTLVVRYRYASSAAVVERNAGAGYARTVHAALAPPREPGGPCRLSVTVSAAGAVTDLATNDATACLVVRSPTPERPAWLPLAGPETCTVRFTSTRTGLHDLAPLACPSERFDELEDLLGAGWAFATPSTGALVYELAVTQAP